MASDSKSAAAGAAAGRSFDEAPGERLIAPCTATHAFMSDA
jgi:hypothetical protein